MISSGKLDPKGKPTPATPKEWLSYYVNDKNNNIAEIVKTEEENGAAEVEVENVELKEDKKKKKKKAKVEETEETEAEAPKRKASKVLSDVSDLVAEKKKKKKKKESTKEEEE